MIKLIFTICFVISVARADSVSPITEAKLRNVDDPNTDPAVYSKLWINLLGNLDQGIKEHLDVYIKRLEAILQDSESNITISNKCASSLVTYFQSPLEQEWTLKMWDSNGHFPSGILSGSFFEPGNFDQCISISTVTQNEDEITGKYCILEIKVPEPIRQVTFNGTKYANVERSVNFVTSWNQFSAMISNGICLPSTCTDEEIEEIIPKVLLDSSSDLRVRTRLCQTMKTSLSMQPMRFGQKVALIILLVNVALAIGGTLVSNLNPNPPKNVVLRILHCFSIWKNTETLFRVNGPKSRQDGTGTTVTKSKDHTQFKFIHGLRAFSIYWVVFAHVFLFHPFLELPDRVSPVQSLMNKDEMVQNLLSHFIVNAGLAVGTFFILSGALTVYSILPVYKHHPINIFSYIMLRWLRFAPPTLGMICIMILWPLTGSGPLFHREFTNFVTDACYSNWWTNFAFITNHMPATEMCNVMSWYLSADFQLHILLYVVVYYFYKRPRLSALYIGTMIVAGFVAPIFIVLAGYGNAPNPSIFLHPQHRFPMEKVTTFIFGTYNHLIPYFFGVILGLLFVRKTPIKISPWVCWTLWLLLFPLTMLLPFASYTFVHTTEPIDTPLESAITFGIVRLIWAGGIFWLCYECSQGRATPIRRILSANILQPFSRLSFAIYLMHIIPIWHHFFSIRTPIAISLQNLLFICVANSVFATLLAYLLYCLFEAPYVNLIKLFVMPLINGKRTRSSSTSEHTDINHNKNANNVLQDGDGATGQTSIQLQSIG